MHTLKHNVLLGAAGAVMGLSAGASAAAINYLGPASAPGQGMGNVATLLSIQPFDGFSTEWGFVEPRLVTRGMNTVVVDRVIASQPVGLNQTWTREDLLDRIPTLNEGNFGLLMNVNEPPTGPAIMIQGFTLRFYTDETDFSQFVDIAYTPGQAIFTQVGPGTGTAGHVFQVDFMDELDFGDWTRVGFRIPSSQFISFAAGGPESFSIVDTAIIPVPVAAQVGGAMLAGIVAWHILRRRASRFE